MSDRLIPVLARRERFKEDYLERRDPIAADRMLWRAQGFRHIVHLLPGQTILEVGCGSGILTRSLVSVSRGENPITAVSFLEERPDPGDLPDVVERLSLDAFPGPLAGRKFDFVIAQDLLDREEQASFLRHVFELLRPGGQVVFYETNPWNVVLRLRRTVQRFRGDADTRGLLNRPELGETVSDAGFVRVFTAFTDFVYAPLTARLIWLLRNASIVLENVPGVRALAGTILVHAQKPPDTANPPTFPRLPVHEHLRNAVSFVIPCRNEESNVRPLVDRLRLLYADYIHEIVLVEDNSTDRTAAIIRELGSEDPRVVPVIRKPPNGVGRALKDGFRVATGRWVLTMDCDFVQLLPELRDLFDAATDEYDVVIGSRFSRHSVLLNYPIGKILVNRAFHVLARIAFRRRFRDLTNNLKLIRREVLDHLELQEPGFAANAETGLGPAVMGYRIMEVPISWINRSADMGTSSFRLGKVGGGYCRVLFRMIKHRAGIRRDS